MTEPILSAMVSTYRGARYLRGCLRSLLDQTIADRIEILVIDAASPEDEGSIVREFQRDHDNIRYVRTETRIGTSAAFNLATGMARGRYLTLANTDDRHRRDFAEILVGILDQRPDVGMVYADNVITRTVDDSFEATRARRRYAWPDYTHLTALGCCLFGAQQVWRKAVHEVVGRWNEELVYANDHHMFARIARAFGALHVATPLGLFLQRDDSVSGANNQRATLDEIMGVLRELRSPRSLVELFPQLEGRGHDPLALAAAWFEFGNVCALSPYTDAQLALDGYRNAVALPLPENQAPIIRQAWANNTAVVLSCAGERDAADHAWKLASADGSSDLAHQNLRTLRALRAEHPQETLPLTAFEFATLDHPLIHESRSAERIEVDPRGELRGSIRTQLPWDVYEGPNGIAWEPRTGAQPPHQDEAPPATDHDSGVETSSEAPHVLIVMYGWDDSGGGTILPRQIALEMARRGQQVSVFYAAAQRDPELHEYALARSHEDGVQLFALKNRPSDFMDLEAPRREVDDPRVRAAFEAVLEEQRPDLVHFFNLHNLGMSLPAAAKQRGLPTVLTSNNYWPICPRLYLMEPNLARCAGNGLEQGDDGSRCGTCTSTEATDQNHRRRAGIEMVNESIDVHLAVSQRMATLYRQHGHAPTHLRVLHQEPPRVGPLWANVGAPRTPVESLDRPLRVAYFGSVMPHKGVHVLLRAIDCLPEGSVETLIVGDVQPDYLQAMAPTQAGSNASARRTAGGRTVLFSGAYAQQDLHRYLALADVVVVPSIWEDCAPFVVAEALAARAPVIGSRIGGIPDFIDEGVTGMLFDGGDAQALAACLARFGEDPTLLGRMQRAIRAPRGLGAHVDDLAAVHAELLGALTPALAPA